MQPTAPTVLSEGFTAFPVVGILRGFGPELTAEIGQVAAAAGLAAIVRDLSTLMTVAIACAGYAAFTLWRLRAGDSVAAARPTWMPAPADDAADREAEAARAKAERSRQALADEDRAMDQVLEKIAREIDKG